MWFVKQVFLFRHYRWRYLTIRETSPITTPNEINVYKYTNIFSEKNSENR